jgi:hypothetical protein
MIWNQNSLAHYSAYNHKRATAAKCRELHHRSTTLAIGEWHSSVGEALHPFCGGVTRHFAAVAHLWLYALYFKAVHINKGWNNMDFKWLQCTDCLHITYPPSQISSMASMTISRFSNTTLFSTFFRKIWLTASYKQLSTLIKINCNKCITYKHHYFPTYCLRPKSCIKQIMHKTSLNSLLSSFYKEIWLKASCQCVLV